MFLPVMTVPMTQAEEAEILLNTGCPQKYVDLLLAFADKYRSSMTSDVVQKNRKLGTRTLVRVASRLAKYPGSDDLHTLLSRSILAEFLPATERMNLEVIFEEVGVKRVTTPVSTFHRELCRPMLIGLGQVQSVACCEWPRHHIPCT